MKKELAESYIDQFPDIPEKMRNKAWQELEHFILFDREGNARCTRCGHEFKIDRSLYRHCDKTERRLTQKKICPGSDRIPTEEQCPNCRKWENLIDVTKRFSGKTTESAANVAFFLAGKDKNLYVRCFYIDIRFKHGQLSPVVCRQEMQRYVFTPRGSARYGPGWCWIDYGSYFRKSYNSNEWTVRTKMTAPNYGISAYYMGDTDIGLENIKKTWLQYSMANEYGKQSNCYIYSYLNFYRTHRGAEKLIKCGFLKFVRSAVEDRDTARLIDWKQSELTKMLGFTKKELDFARKAPDKLADCIKAKKIFPKLPVEDALKNCESFNNSNGRGWSDNIVYILDAVPDANIMKIGKYLKKNGISAVLYKDYIYFCKKLKYDLTDKVILYPPHFFEAHDRANSACQAVRDEEAARENELKMKKFEQLKKQRKKLEFEFEDLVIIQPQSAAEIVNEGKMLSHCVGGYAQQHLEGKTNILFIRKKSTLQTPYFTIEVTKELDIKQCHGYKNEQKRQGRKPDKIKRLETAYQEYLDKLKKSENNSVRQKVRITA
ncbi:MAG: PcfJ domain-containing protein [[Eubacterium] siraeum]|nr:PcfJ domain-containing protein [[Eubacterium] siraeum]